MFGLFRKREKILLYTDSRGDNIPGQLDYDHYGVLLSKRYKVEKYLCPEKWTTTLDFLDLVQKKDLNKYDFVILHTGIVDHSPRHQKIANENIYPDKKQIFDKIFGEEIIKGYLSKDFGLEYEGDKTINLYSLDMAERYLIPELNKIPNLIWISSNKIVPNWNGNYWKERPKNIRLIEEYSNLFISKLGGEKVINLMTWSEEEIKKYTFDNMHPNKAGSDYILRQIEKKIN
ncbi:hypothetical protein CVU76_01140 [Candidatus Dojkabacteria bacterium HGW-Dojkabacteria-1]|uniref:SGNH hydrolase-type esterase domain-containing protein n=1 Tax=Candidatus Dojkabacteria bacterium HGW-Dojkabacteria-1 TaxID=2013761 RepID=A0A2N2F379_9BACT|nr:MAG: hypothetical protein CVU76_01140 [Candidatus Dojkabacteria bacterium HGW-Dojkabacteria-1]